MRIIQVQKMIIGEETVAIEIVIRLTKVVAMTIEDNVIVAIVIETEAEKKIGGVGMTTSAKHPLDLLRTKKVMTEREATRIIIIGTTGGIVIAIGTIGTGAEIAAIAVNGTGDIPETTGRKIDIGTSVRAITRKGIARDRDRGTGRHRYHLGR